MIARLTARWFYPAQVLLNCAFAVAMHLWRPNTPGVECGFVMALVLTVMGVRDRERSRFIEVTGELVSGMHRLVDAVEQCGADKETVERMRFDVLELSHALPAKKTKP